MPLHRIKIATLAAFALSIFAMPNIALADDTGLSFDPAPGDLTVPTQYGVTESLKEGNKKKLPAATGFDGIPEYSLTAVAVNSSDMALENQSQVVADEDGDLMPKGLAFVRNPILRSLSGSPEADAVGIYRMTYTASGKGAESGRVLTDTFTLTVTANQPPVFNAAKKSDFDAISHNYLVGKAIPNLQLPFADGGEGPISMYSLTTTIDSGSGGRRETDVETGNTTPAGLMFNATTSSRTLSGMPTAAGIYNLIYKADDSDNKDNMGNTDPDDTAEIEFTIVVEMDRPPTLTGDTKHTRLKDRPMMQIDLPTAGGGNFGLTDSLSGTYKLDADATAIDVTVDEMDGSIRLSDNAGTATGLKFTERTGSNVATITGTGPGTGTSTSSPLVTGIFVLDYKVVDGDSNEKECDGVGDQSGCDTATESVTLVVMDPVLTLTGGVAASPTVVLKKDVGLGSVTPITLPTVGGNVSHAANITRVLKSKKTHDGSGDETSGQTLTPVDTGDAAVPGLTYTAATGTWGEASFVAGKLTGMPTAAGKWELTYTVTDDNDTSPTDDDAPASITFTVQVVEDVDLALDSDVKADLDGKIFNRVTGGTVGADAGTAFALPAIDSSKGGNTPITQRLTTVCTPSNTCTAGTDKTPKGLTFTAGTPAGLTGTFDNAGTYEVTYTVTDTLIANETYQTPDIANTDTVTFILEVAQNSAPTLTSLDAIDPGFTTREVSINLPVAGGGNPVDGASDIVLTDSLSGTHKHLGDGTTAEGVTVDMTESVNKGLITLSNGNTTGLRFTQRAGDGAGKEATIEGTLAAGTAGTFNLTYTVVDGDRNVKGECTSANTPPDCDTATVSVTLMVTDPMISLAPDDGVVGVVADKDAVLLVQDEALLGTAMTLPMVGGNVSDSGNTNTNITYVLTSEKTHDGSGTEIVSSTPTPVDASTAALPGLTYAADTGMVAGKLTGTPTEAGTWKLTYTVTDDNGTTTGPNHADDDLPASITFTVQVVTDDMPVLESVRNGDLSGMTFNRVTGGTVGADEDTAFALPVFTGGNGDKAESLTTCKLLDNSEDCDPAATAAVDTAGGNETPNGLTFTAGTPAELTGVFGSVGTYKVTYTVTDTKIENSSAYQPADDADDVNVVFKLAVAENSAPTLTSLDAIDPGFTTREVEIELPVAGGGNPVDGASNIVLTDSLSGTHDGNPLTVPANGGAIRLTDTATTPTGLMFTPRTPATMMTAAAPATITGIPTVAGTFELIYKVVDGDRNVQEACDGVGDQLDCDTATVAVTLTVKVPTLTLAGGVTGNVVKLKRGERLTTNITLPREMGNVAQEEANITRVLTSKLTAGSSSGTPIGNSMPALPGLTYTAATSSTAGSLMGTPSTAGKWTLTYTVTNNNGTRNDTSDDLTPDAISFMVEVVEDTTPALGSLSSASFNRVTGSTVGADADTAFALPAITAATGNGAITESLTTALHGGQHLHD